MPRRGQVNLEGLVTRQPKEMLFRPVIRFWDLSPFLVERLCNALRPLMIFPLVEGVGFGYLVPQQVLKGFTPHNTQIASAL